jgi:REP element-mobilizing transposase RayT
LWGNNWKATLANNIKKTMSRSYRFSPTSPLHFVSYATVGWVDVFTRVQYKAIILESLRYCMENKGLDIYAWCIMTNHVHLIMGTQSDVKPEKVLGLHKRHTSEALHKTIVIEVAESRREWMIDIFCNAGKPNSNNHGNFFNFGNNTIILLNCIAAT